MREPVDIQLRGAFLLTIVLLGMLFLLGRLFQLQILSQEDWIVRSRQNQVRAQQVSAHRGLILDRNREVLVDNRPSYILYGIPAILLRDSSAVYRLAETCDRDPEILFKRLHWGGPGSMKAQKLASDLDFDTRVILAENIRSFPGIKVQIEGKRFYENPIMPHSLGYLGEIGDKELLSSDYPEASGGDLIGRKGLEHMYHKDLVGIKGIDYLTVDSRGREQGRSDVVPSIEPIHGKDLVLTIDRDLQLYAEELIGDKQGAVILMENRTGRILTAVSKPDFLLEYFSGRMPPDVWSRLSDEGTRPLLNRLVQGLYPPGSLFKIAVAAWALENGIVDETFTVNCTGAFQLGRRTAKCWKLEGHGKMNMRQAIQHSCDVWFYQVGLKLSPDDIRKAGEVFGLGSGTGIDIVGEKFGLLPDTEWYDKHLGKKGWTRGILLNLAIGQGEVLVTPIQLASYASILANRGYSYPPHFADLLIDRSSGEEIRFNWPRQEIELSERTWKLIERSSRDVIETPGGTAHFLKRHDYQVAGKTGTAENPHGDDHSLFMAWMPEPDPEVVAVAVIENAGHGSEVAAPLVFKLFDAWNDMKNGKLVEFE
jgi:penicillin-binding protein 2